MNGSNYVEFRDPTLLSLLWLLFWAMAATAVISRPRSCLRLHRQPLQPRLCGLPIPCVHFRLFQDCFVQAYKSSEALSLMIISLTPASFERQPIATKNNVGLDW